MKHYLLLTILTCLSFSQVKVIIGDTAPEVKIKTLDGKQFSLTSNSNKVTYLVFFSTHCRNCRVEIPRIEKEIFKAYQSNDNFQLLAIGRQQTEEHLKSYKQSKNISFPMASDLKSEIFDKYAKDYVPHNFIIGKDGKIKYAHMGYNDNSFAQLKEALAKELKSL